MILPADLLWGDIMHVLHDTPASGRLRLLGHHAPAGSHQLLLLQCHACMLLLQLPGYRPSPASRALIAVALAAAGVRIPVPNEAPDTKLLTTPQPTAAATELPSGSPAVQQQPLPPNAEPVVSAEAKEDAAFLAAAQAAASAPMSTDTAAADAALLPPADCGAAVQPNSPCAGSGNGSGARRIRFAKQHSLPNAVGKASCRPLAAAAPPAARALLQSALRVGCCQRR